ncbi:MAG: DUF3108 domain-containing protein [Burkholderiaceae bacterium]|nr:DUF3108 domain-containing protein [Burkholderiaceae bacterium]
MSLATQFLRRHRRLLLLCAATLLLHLLAIDWVGSYLAGARQGVSPAPAALMTAQLRLDLPRHVATPELAPLAPIPALSAAARRARPAAIAPIAPPAATPASTGVEALLTDAGAMLAMAEAPSQPQSQAGAAQAQTAATAPPVAEAAASAAPLEMLPPQAMRRYKVHLPPSADFDMDVVRIDADGTRWNGSASMRWHTDGSQYEASVEAGLNLLVTRLNLLVMRSRGSIDDFGIAPTTSMQKRARRAETATHFNRDAGTITFSASERSYPLLVGAQDMTTVPFQLGGIGRADTNQFASDIDMQVGEDREATIFRFQLVGEEELDTRLGKLITWHLSRPARPGSYTSKLDIWLAPGLNWLPVQLRNTEASGALTTQTVSRITTNVTGK